jgi:type IX secretion system PorP/SprF family membrane protein
MAQQDAGFSQYFFNQLYINPAYAGSRDALSGTVVHRSQWVGMPGAPVTQSATVHSPLPRTRAGAGVQLYNDRYGPISNTGLTGVYSYYVPVGDYKLAFGLSGTFSNMRMRRHEIQVEDPSDPAFSGNTNSWTPDAGAGIYLYKDRFYAGVSALHLFESKFGLSANADDPNAAKFYRHYYVTTGAVFKVNDFIDFRPSILAKGVQAAPVTFDLNASFIFYQKFFAGAGFRTAKRVNLEGLDNQVVAIVEYQFRGFRVGYSYDYFLNRPGEYNYGTHEIMLGFDLNLSKTKMSSPIFF